MLTSDNNGCSESEYCDEDSSHCNCLKGYIRVNVTLCIKTDDQTSPKDSSIENGDSGSVTIYILAPLFIIVFVICGIYINRKYHLVTWIKNKIHQNNENYDEFMIGQDLDDDDDPPLHWILDIFSCFNKQSIFQILELLIILAYYDICMTVNFVIYYYSLWLVV